MINEFLIKIDFVVLSRFRPQEENASVTSASGSTPCDLLGSIFQGQQMLHMNTNKIKIHRDGIFEISFLKLSDITSKCKFFW